MKIIGAIFILFLTLSCSKDSDLKALYNDIGNHKVFKIEANLSPLQEIISSEDTLWITIDLPGLELMDEVSDNLVSFTNARLLTQIELYDQIDEERVVDVQYILENGEIYDDEIDYTESGKNSYGFQFGYPNETKFKIGVMLPTPGRYAIWFNNFPNPYYGCNGSDCDSGKGFWYDIYSNWNNETDDFDNEDFVDYYFNTEGGNYDYTKYDSDPFLKYCIYPESVFFITVR